MRFLLRLGWLACCVYATIPSFWLMIHPRAGYWRSRRTSPYRVLIPLWIAMWIVAALLTAPWRNVALYQTPWSWIPAAGMFATGIWLYRKSRANFSPRQLGGLPELRPHHPETRLVTEGIHSRIRHPIYVAHLCEMLAWSAGTGLVVCYALTLFAIFTGAFMIRREDAELEQRFGEQFRRYRQSVPAVLPRPL